MVSGLKGEVIKSRVDPCAKCHQRVTKQLMLCTKCSKWVHARCTTMKSFTTLAKGFTCDQFVITIKELKKKCHFLTRSSF